MAPNMQIVRAIAALDYRATVGDVAAQSGLDVQTAERELLALASQGGGHLQASTSGEIAYVFPRDFRAILRKKFFALRLREFWRRVWPVLFAGIRISFGILLLISIVLIYVTIFVVIIYVSSQQKDNRGRRSSFNAFNFNLRPFWFLFFDNSWRYRSGGMQPRGRTTTRESSGSSLNFLEAIYSFLFGDGNPNADIEERRWQLVAGTIRNHGGAIAAEQISPYLDDLGTGDALEYEDYMLPVLTRFNGVPEVSPQGDIVYRFPELQVTAGETSGAEEKPRALPAYLQGALLKFSSASSQQIVLAIALGAVNLVGIAMLGVLLRDANLAAEIGGLALFVSSILGLLAAYGVAFLAIPLGRYFWVQRKNQTLQTENSARQERALQFANAKDGVLKQKLDYARTFADRAAIAPEDILYSSDRDLLAQELERSLRADETP